MSKAKQNNIVEQERRSVVDEPWWIQKTPTKWLSLAQTATYLGLTPVSITRYVNDENYAHLNFPRPSVLVDSWRWDVNEIDAWMRSRIGATSSRKMTKEGAR